MTYPYLFDLNGIDGVEVRPVVGHLGVYADGRN